VRRGVAQSTGIRGQGQKNDPNVGDAEAVIPIGFRRASASDSRNQVIVAAFVPFAAFKA